eukprot:1160573-Pelagomonas_calceolata.AAC.21
MLHVAERVVLVECGCLPPMWRMSCGWYTNTCVDVGAAVAEQAHVAGYALSRSPVSNLTTPTIYFFRTHHFRQKGTIQRTPHHMPGLRTKERPTAPPCDHYFIPKTRQKLHLHGGPTSGQPRFSAFESPYLPNLSVPGLSGLRYEHVKSMSILEEGLGFNLLLTGPFVL